LIKQALPFVGPAVAFVAVAASWVASSVDLVPRILLADVALIALAAGVILTATRRGGTGSKVLSPWLASGALLGAAAIGPPTFALWIALAALAFAASGTLSSPRGRPRLRSRLGLVAGAGFVNAVFLWVFLLGSHRPVDPTEFQSKALRVHTLLADVPLHDVWMVRLRGGEDRTMQDVRTLFMQGFTEPETTALVGVAAFRMLLGRVFGWDSEECDEPASSYAHHLSDADRERSLHEPGDHGFVYTFQDEALVEIVNCTVHAFVAMALEPTEGGYILYWAVYVKRNSWITPYYMALIDPFRRLIVYPSIIERVEKRWHDNVGHEENRDRAIGLREE
jgi:membrane protein implicated in regulation of membrane protease activity